MNTKTIITIFFLAFAQLAFAQKEQILTYEKFDELSKTISDLQMKKTDLKIDGQDISFPKDNFKIFYSDKLGTYSLNMTLNGQQYLVLCEDIDFSKAIGLFTDNETIHVMFPENHLNLQLYGDQGNANTSEINSLQFYTNSDTDREIMFKAVYDLIILMKYDKGIMTPSDGGRDLHKYKTMKPYEFLQQYPNSVLAYEGLLLEEDFNKQKNFYKLLEEKYDVPWYKRKIWEIEDKVSLSKLLKAKNRKYNFGLLPFKHYFQQQDYFANYIHVINQYYYPDESQVLHVQYTVLVTKEKIEAIKKAEDLRQELIQNFDSNSIVKNYNANDIQFARLFEDEDAFLSNQSEANNTVIELDFSKETQYGLVAINENYDYKNIRLSTHTMDYKNETYYTVAISFF